jgi:hypothetical protein
MRPAVGFVRISLRSIALAVLVCISDSRSDALSGLGEFKFINPGVTLTKEGPGFELSAGRNGLGSGKALLLGALGRYEPEDNRKEAGIEFGLALFLIEAGVSFSDKSSGEFFAPDLCLPISLSGGGEKGLVLNLFYRIYPHGHGENTFGGSLKFAWTWL